MADIVYWGDYGKIVTNNAGDKLLTSTRPGADHGKLVRRSAILADIEWSGSIDVEYLKSTTYDPQAGDYIAHWATDGFTPAAYHEPLWRSDTDGSDTYWWSEGWTPAWSRYAVSTHGKNSNRYVSPVYSWSAWMFPTVETHLLYWYEYGIVTPRGMGTRTPEDALFCVSIILNADHNLYVRTNETTSSWTALNIQGYTIMLTWTAPINTTLAKPFPNAETTWTPRSVTENFSAWGSSPYSTCATWPAVEFTWTGEHLNNSPDIATAHIYARTTPVVTFHQEEPVDPSIPANP